MKKRIFGYVMKEINRLTKDDDLRQELWLYFLEGNSPFSFQEYLDFLTDKQDKLDSLIIYTDKMESIYGFKKKL